MTKRQHKGNGRRCTRGSRVPIHCYLAEQQAIFRRHLQPDKLGGALLRVGVRLPSHLLVLDQQHVPDLLQRSDGDVAGGRRQGELVILQVDVDHRQLLRQHIKLLDVSQGLSLLSSDDLQRT
jgi:hypothetical protein